MKSTKYMANVPESVMTPEKVHTELLGDLEFFDGMPSKATVKKAYDFLDASRGVEAFLNGMPAASIYGLLEGFKEGGVNPGDWNSPGFPDNSLRCTGLRIAAHTLPG